MTNLTSKLAAIVCTLVLSTTMVLGAVAPAQVSTAEIAADIVTARQVA